jgi:chemotaxis protein methyltransferase CheR
MTGVVEIDSIERFRTIIADRLGLNFEEGKIGFLADVLRRRIDRTGHSCEHYLDLLNGSQGELHALARELTVGETYFFRNIDQFRAFSEVALPDRVRIRNSQKTLRILSAGCASGEEAYSLAILLLKARLDPSWDVSILAVDVNPAMIEAAVQSRFSSWALRETPPEVRQQWLRSDARGLFSLDPALGRNIRFDVRNLVSDDPDLWQPKWYDVIFCRNVIMYFTPDASRKVVERITKSLAPGGYLFLGHAETLRGLSNDFHLHHTHGTFYYQRRETTSPEAPKPAAEPPASRSRPEAQPALLDLESAQAWMDTIRKSTQRIQEPAARPASRPVHNDLANPGAPKWDLALPLDLL